VVAWCFYCGGVWRGHQYSFAIEDDLPCPCWSMLCCRSDMNDMARPLLWCCVRDAPLVVHERLPPLGARLTHMHQAPCAHDMFRVCVCQLMASSGDRGVAAERQPQLAGGAPICRHAELAHDIVPKRPRRHLQIGGCLNAGVGRCRRVCGRSGVC
jgi:hypothetical protein